MENYREKDSIFLQFFFLVFSMTPKIRKIIFHCIIFLSLLFSGFQSRMNMIVVKEHEISFHRITLSTLQCSVPLQEKDKRGQKEFEISFSFLILFYFIF